MGLLDAPGISRNDPRLPKRAAPVTTAASANGYNPDLFGYNFKPANTRRLRTAITRALAGQGLARLAFQGDSTTYGQGATGYANGPVDQVRGKLVAAGLPSAGTGPVYTNDPDTRWVFSGTWSTWATFKAGFRLTTTIGASATFTSDQAGTTLSFAYLDEGNVQFSYAIDGGAATTVTQTDTHTLKKITVNGLANTTHAVVITMTAAGTGATVYIAWASVYNPSGLLLGRFGVSGSMSADQISGAKYYANTYVAANWAPDCTMLDLTVNDARAVNGPVAVATYKANHQSTITLLKAAGDVILATAAPLNTGDSLTLYTKALYELADTNNLPLIDVTQAFGGTYVAGNMFDTIHPNAAGYGIKATALANALLMAWDSVSAM